MLTGHPETRGGQVRREAEPVETLFLAGGRTDGICCAFIPSLFSVLLVASLHNIKASVPNPLTNAILFCVILGQFCVKSNWS